jgi:hypothetical protein
VLADEAEDDAFNLLPAAEAQFVSAAMAAYDSIRAQLAPLRSALAAPEFVTAEEWSSLGSNVASASELLPSPPQAFTGIAEIHQSVRNAAAELGRASAAGPTHPDAGIEFIDRAVQVAAINGATERLEVELATAEVTLEVFLSVRLEELELREEQEEQAETATGLADLLGISLDPMDYCFIATAAYGTPAAKEIDVLREFRDKALQQTVTGRAFVQFYYATSPPMADFIAAHEWLRTTVREGFVDPIVWTVELTRPLWDCPS